jgi:hypothetical protein
MNYTEIRDHTNARCLKCNCVEEVMKRIGCFVMCEKCTKQEFPKEVGKSHYLKWLHKYNKTY